MEAIEAPSWPPLLNRNAIWSMYLVGGKDGTQMQGRTVPALTPSALKALVFPKKAVCIVTLSLKNVVKWRNSRQSGNSMDRSARVYTVR
jgi:hypothetical protein